MGSLILLLLPYLLLAQEEGDHSLCMSTPEGKIISLSTADGTLAYQYRYDSRNRPISARNSATQDKVEISYDSEGQLTQENINGLKTTYRYDSSGKRVEMILPDGSSIRYFGEGEVARYSSAGELLYTAKPQETGVTSLEKDFAPTTSFPPHQPYLLTFDLLGRVSSITEPQSFQITFTYDGFHRKIAESLSVWDNGAWQEPTTRRFIYDHQVEIGSVDEEGNLIDLKVFARSSPLPTTFEFEGEAFLPLHDEKGNVSHLLSLEEHRVVARYTYDGGRELAYSGPLAPWRFGSRRILEEGHLADFGEKLYDLDKGSWVVASPDKEAFPETTFTYSFALDLGLLIQHYCYSILPSYSGLRKLGLFLSECLGAPPKLTNPVSDYVDFVGREEISHNHVNVWINGLNTELLETITYAEFISDACGGEKTYYVYNPTDGFVTDVLAHSLDQLGFPPPNTVQIALEAIERAIQEVGEEGAVTIFSHSQGGMILRRALEKLPPASKKKLEIYTFGSASLFYDVGTKELKHFVASCDFITQGADPLTYLRLSYWRPDVLVVRKSTCEFNLDNHAVLGPIYRKEIERLGLEMQNRQVYDHLPE